MLLHSWKSDLQAAYRLSKIEDKSQLFAIVWGLATAAVVMGSEKLGNYEPL